MLLGNIRQVLQSTILTKNASNKITNLSKFRITKTVAKMKKSLLLFFVILSVYTHAQKNKNGILENFSIKNNDVFWEKTYATSLKFKQVVTNTKMAGVLDKPDIDSPMIFGMLLPFEGNYRGTGYGYLETAYFISKGFLTGHTTINYTNDSCTVTVKRIVSSTKTSDPFDLLTEQRNTTTLYKTSARREKFRNNFKQIGRIIDYTLDSFFNPIFAE